MNFTQKMIDKAKEAGSVEELLAFAQEQHIEMTAEEAASYLEKLKQKTGELADDELDNVSGGGCGYASASIDGHYYKLVNDRTDSCSRFVCMSCGGGLRNHAPNCEWGDNYCLYCIHSGGHQLIGSYCKAQWK